MTYYYAIVVILVYNYSSMHFCIGIFLVKDILLSVVRNQRFGSGRTQFCDSAGARTQDPQLRRLLL